MASSAYRAARAASESDPLLGETSVDYSSESALVRRTRRKYPPRRATQCAVCCAYYSASSSLFLVWIGVYASVGWDYQGSGWAAAQVPVVQQNAFLAAALYFATFLASVYVWQRDERVVRELDTEMTLYRERDE